MQPTDGSWRSLVADYWPTDQIANVLAVMSAESSDNPNAYHLDDNGTADRGLLQINSDHAALVGGQLGELYDPVTNVRVAAEVWRQAGGSWCPWSTAPKLGLCK